MWTKVTYSKVIGSGFLLGLAAAAACNYESTSIRASTPLSGLVQSSSGESLAGIPVRARLLNSNIAVTVFTNKEGRYAYRELLPGLYTLSIKVAEFEPVQKEAVNITSQESMQLDFDLQSRSASFDELTTSELLLALPGTDKWKITVARCSNCHNLQFALPPALGLRGY